MTDTSATRKGVEPRGERTLTPKQARFVDEYLVDLNATQAAIRAGYSAKTARAIGYENLTRPDVALAIEAKRKELAATVGITRERVLTEMAKLAFSDLRQLYNEDGSLKHPHEWPEGAAGAVAGMDFAEEREDGKVIGYVKKLKLWDKGKQLENLLRHLGMDQDAARAPEDNIGAKALDALAAKIARFAPKEAA